MGISRKLLDGGTDGGRDGENKGVLEELDGWIRHKLRALLWRQWKRPYPWAKDLMRSGIDEARA